MRYQAETPRHEGLYTPHTESDACGTGFIANLTGDPSHKLVTDALTMLINMEHRKPTEDPSLHQVEVGGLSRM